LKRKRENFVSKVSRGASLSGRSARVGEALRHHLRPAALTEDQRLLRRVKHSSQLLLARLVKHPLAHFAAGKCTHDMLPCLWQGRQQGRQV